MPIIMIISAFAALIALCDTVREFYEQFYGKRKAPILPTARRRFLEECRAVQRTVGPETKGSNLFFYGGNERRE